MCQNSDFGSRHDPSALCSDPCIKSMMSCKDDPSIATLVDDDTMGSLDAMCRGHTCSAADVVTLNAAVDAGTMGDDNMSLLSKTCITCFIAHDDDKERWLDAHPNGNPGDLIALYLSFCGPASEHRLRS